MSTTIAGAQDAKKLIGEELGVSEWYDVSQVEIDRFASVTDDHQWIHVDARRAAASELGTTIAHGLLTLSLGPKFSYEIYSFEGFSAGLNYGYERVRFPAPLPAGSRLRMRATLIDVVDVAGGVQATVRQTFEREGSTKPVCVADSVTRWLV
jgi:acyl dehydratase